ncbi:EAL domain-containing protein [Stappia sediminis]|uniref:EAL domain-containing protein n=1 Tax=Stappia sediminis TaxID=2692190 RepID=UPI001AD93410|nr:cyclic diguanylate phosphodiesterase [Stappia sediminis]
MAIGEGKRRDGRKIASFAGLVVLFGNRRLVRMAVLTATFVMMLGVGGAILSIMVGDDLSRQNDAGIGEYEVLTIRSFELITLLERQVTAEACSPAFLEGMRKLAFLPDGINSILYAQDGVIACTSNAGKLEAPVIIGEPDLAASESGATFDIWFDRPQGALGLPGETGTIVGGDGFLVTMPEISAPASLFGKSSREVVFRVDDETWISRGGRAGLYAVAGMAGAGGFNWADWSFYGRDCGESGLYCAASRAPLSSVISSRPFEIGGFLAFSGIVALFVGGLADRGMRSYWSLAARFVRGLTPERMECVYQPVVRMETGEIVGVEVLSRWRDADGRVVFPDTFLPIVNERGLSRRLTEIVIGKARQELGQHLPAEKELQVAFNISPRDYKYDFLRPLFDGHEPGTARLGFILEIVETESFDLSSIKLEMMRLRRQGVRTYIDDFGVGFSNIGNLAELPIDGVKLDRGFSMAPDGSLWANMLPRALELIGSAGHRVVVEGVETGERFEMLKKNRHATFAQGYFIARPMPVEALVAFLKTYPGNGPAGELQPVTASALNIVDFGRLKR